MTWCEWSKAATSAIGSLVSMCASRALLPNALTVAALCSGLTALKLAVEGRYELAVSAILLAGLLDAADGRVARMVDGTSKFGAELDSLADAIAFGAAPALILYFWTLNTLGPLGWLAALAFASAIALRLARFNVASERGEAANQKNDCFSGMPAPAAAIFVLLPLYVTFDGAVQVPAASVALYVVVVSGLAISKAPFYAGKSIPLFTTRSRAIAAVVMLAFAALLAAMRPWLALSALSAAYVLSVPLFVLHRRRVSTGDATGASTLTASR